MTVIRTRHLEATQHLALEEALLEEAERYAPALLLWRSAAGVVIGKNQNPWRECRTDRLAADGAGLTRRVSGGGAVYHDEGNLNFTLILRRAAYDEAAQFDLVRRALDRLGLAAALLNRNSLGIDGMKVSGNAFCFRRRAALHHGTLLVQSDLERLRRYLAPGSGRYDTHAIASVPARVANLSDFCSGLQWEDAAAALEEVFRETDGDTTPALYAEDLDLPGLADHQARHASGAWRLGRTPQFTARWPLAREGEELVFRVEQGHVVDARRERRGEPMDGTGLAPLVGGRYDAGELAKRLDPTNPTSSAVRACLREHPFRWVP